MFSSEIIRKSDVMGYGLIGENLSYSFSKLIHEKLGDYPYELFGFNSDQFAAYMAGGHFDGLNITVPYKKAVMPFCDEISEIAKEIGAVNTVYQKDGKRFGTNTDYDGFVYMAQRCGISFKGKKVLILGAGGTSLTVQKCVRDGGAREISVAYRNHNFEADHDAEIIVNTTPVGTFPNNGEKIIDLAQFPTCEGVLDVVYNPLRTDLLLRAKEKNIPHSDGLPMLVAQATAAATLFTGKDYGHRNEEIIEWLLSSIQNIVLIGMPGSGKSTVGKYLAEKLGKTFVDLDEAIVQAASLSIPDIFSKYGEPVFRDMETAAAKEYGKQKGLVIATGGGVVLKKENMDALMQNGVLFFLNREISKLATDGRPLSTGIEALQKMDQERRPLYETYGDYVIDVSEDVAETGNKIEKIIRERK